MPKSYLPKRKLAHGARRGDKFLERFENAHAKVKSMIDNIEDPGNEDSALLSLQSYEDGNVPAAVVYEMLMAIRADLLEIDRELYKANEALNGDGKTKPILPEALSAAR